METTMSRTPFVAAHLKLSKLILDGQRVRMDREGYVEVLAERASGDVGDGR